MNAYLLIAIGSALGGMARYACSTWIMLRTGGSFPWGTLAVNVIGSCLIGMLAAWGNAQDSSLSLPARQFLMVGVLGGYTTFSSFSVETLLLARNGQWSAAGWNVLLSTALCLLGVWLGYLAAAAFNAWRG